MVNDIHNWLTVVNATRANGDHHINSAADATTAQLDSYTGETGRFDSNIGSRFRSVGKLGSGGMCSVHESEDLRLLRRTALKVMHPRLADDAALRNQFIVEAQVTAQLEHPNIIPVYEFGQDAVDVPYLNMRKVSGRTLNANIHIDHSMRLHRENLKSAVRTLLRICDALSYAHSRGVVHCDVKPANIMVGEFGQAYLMDWGIALTGTRPQANDPVLISDALRGLWKEAPIALGTPAYMAPEQTSGGHANIDERTDVFLFGATLYHLLTGQAPYQHAETTKDCIDLAERAAYPSIKSCLPQHRPPPSLVRVAEQALARDPDERFQNMAAVGGALWAFLEGIEDLQIERYAPGETIVREGDAGDRAFIIAAGRCEVYTDAQGVRQVLRELRPGDVFGEMAILSGGFRIASVAAVTNVELEIVTKEALTDGLGINTWLGRFVTTLAERFKDADRRARDTDV